MRQTFHTFLSITGILIALFLVACAAGKKDFSIAVQLQEAGKNKEALAYMEQAAAKEPHNTKYQQALQEMRKSMIEKHLAEAEKILDTAAPLDIEAVGQAKTELNKAKELAPQKPDVQKLEERIEKAEAALLKEIQTLYAKAKEHLARNEWLEASFTLQQIQSKFPNYEDSALLLAEVTDKGLKFHYTRAQQAYDDSNYELAKKHLEKALAIQADHQPSRELMGQLKEKNTKGYFLKKAKEAVQEQQWSAAYDNYKKALEFDPENEKLQNIVDNVRLRAGGYYLEQSKKALDSGYLFKAYEQYKHAAALLETKGGAKLKEIEESLILYMKTAAGQAQEKEHYGMAWYWYTVIKELDPKHPKIFFLIQAMEDTIKQRVQKSIAVFDFSSPSNNSDAGLILSNNLITYLFNNASGDIKILERENLKSVLEEMKLGQIGIVSTQTAKEMGKIYGIDVAIMGSVLLYKVEETTSKETKTARYKVGTEIQDNIKYLNWKAKHPHPTQMQLAKAPPAKIEVPKYKEKEYTISKKKKVGFVQISFRIVDVHTGENIQVRTIERKEVVEDETGPGVPEADIAFDPLEMPTDTELMQSLTADIVAELGRETLKPLRNLEQTYYKMAETQLRRRESALAVENFVNAIFDEKMKRVQNSPLTQNALTHIQTILQDYKLTMGE